MKYNYEWHIIVNKEICLWRKNKNKTSTTACFLQLYNLFFITLENMVFHPCYSMCTPVLNSYVYDVPKWALSYLDLQRIQNTSSVFKEMQ